MNNAFYIRILLEDGKRVIEIAKINLVIFYGFARNFFDAF